MPRRRTPADNRSAHTATSDLLVIERVNPDPRRLCRGAFGSGHLDRNRMRSGTETRDGVTAEIECANPWGPGRDCFRKSAELRQ
jgi:hypothetical protein